jgi:general secretion pathway protein G
MHAPRGFTLIELLVVMAIVGLMLSIVAPRYAEHVDRSRETVMRSNLTGLREAIDKFYADRTRYPNDLAELARERYIRQLPIDPLTDRSDTWTIVHPSGKSEGVYDVHSGASGTARDGTVYASW